jgi:large subunit ribosomal protein L24
MKLHTGDTVLITAGKDKGQRGTIQKVLPRKDRVVVEGKNVYKRFRKGVGDQKGGVLEYSRPLPSASVALVCPKCGKQTRVAYSTDKKGEKSRICAKCKAIIEKVAKK